MKKIISRKQNPEENLNLKQNIITPKKPKGYKEKTVKITCLDEEGNEHEELMTFIII